MERKVGAGSDDVFEERGAESAALAEGMEHDGASAGGFAGDGDVSWVAAKLGDVGLNPLECEALIEDAGIGNAVAAELVRGEEAESTEAVLNCDADKVVVVGVDDGGEVVLTVSSAVATAVNR